MAAQRCTGSRGYLAQIHINAVLVCTVVCRCAALRPVARSQAAGSDLQTVRGCGLGCGSTSCRWTRIYSMHPADHPLVHALFALPLYLL